MIIVKLFGGLGNQMYQYATAKRVAIKNNTNVKFDLSWFKSKKAKNPKRTFGLDVYNIKIEKATIIDLLNIGIFSGIIFRILKKINLISNKTYKKEKTIKTFPYYPLDPEVLEFKDNIYMEGYWQREEYFQDISDILLKDFTLKEKSECCVNIAKEILSSISSVSIHIRRGDYVTINEALGIEYYTNAIKEIHKHIEKPFFFVFSDDIDWVKKNLTFDSAVKLVEGMKDCEDLYLMSLCQNHIIANSSFSRWGAWLSKNKNSVILSPKEYISSETKRIHFLKDL
jgi:hypothetical protein